jgi:hypothetical protein
MPSVETGRRAELCLTLRACCYIVRSHPRAIYDYRWAGLLHAAAQGNAHNENFANKNCTAGGRRTRNQAQNDTAGLCNADPLCCVI